MTPITALCGKNGFKYVNGMHGNTTSTVMGKTYTTRPQGYSDATVTYSLRKMAYNHVNNSWSDSNFEQHNQPIGDALQFLGSLKDPTEDIDVFKFQINVRDKVVYEIIRRPFANEDISIDRVQNCLRLFL